MSTPISSPSHLKQRELYKIIGIILIYVVYHNAIHIVSIYEA
jgi:hypothetical protein